MNQASVNAFGNALAAQIKAVGPSLAAASRGFGQALAQQITASGQAAAAVIRSLGSLLTGAIRGIGAAVAQNIGSLGKLASGLGAGVGSAVKGVGAGVGSVLKGRRGSGGGTRGFRDSLNDCTNSLKRFGQTLIAYALGTTVTGFETFKKALHYTVSALTTLFAPALAVMSAVCVLIGDAVNSLVLPSLGAIGKAVFGTVLPAFAALGKMIQDLIRGVIRVIPVLTGVFAMLAKKTGLIDEPGADAMYDAAASAASKLRDIIPLFDNLDAKLAGALDVVLKDIGQGFAKNSKANVGWSGIADAWKQMQVQSFERDLDAKQLAAQEKAVKELEGLRADLQVWRQRPPQVGAFVP